MQESKPSSSSETGSPAAGHSGQEDRNQRYWFHILAQNMPAAVTDLARRIERVGLEFLIARDLHALLR